MKKLSSCLALLLALIMLAGSGHIYAASKIALSPASSSITEGHSQAISVTLDQPIVAPPPNNTVILSITSSNPELATISPSTIVYTATDWYQTKSFTVTVPTNGVHSDSTNVLITAKASSGAAYYDTYVAGASVYVTDMTPAPAYNAPGEVAADNPYTYPAPVRPVITTPAPQPSPAPTVAVPQASSGGTKYVTVEQDARLDSSLTKAAVDDYQPKNSFNRVSSLFISGTASTSQQVIAYLLLALATAVAVILPVLIIRRDKWQKRLKNRHMRWMERQTQKAAATGRKPSVKKAKSKKKRK